jgi:hypothetical protein
MIKNTLGLLGAIGCIVSIFLPFERHRALFPMMGGNGTASSSLFSYMPVLALCLLGASVAFIWFWQQNEQEKIKFSTWGLCGTSSLILLYGLYSIVNSRRSYSSSSFSITEYSERGDGFSIDIGWIALALCTVCCFVASRMESPASETTMIRPTTYVKGKDTGQCLQCGQPNSIAATICHTCRATLPWAMRNQSTRVQQPKASEISFNNPDILQWMQTAGGNLLTSLFCLTIPILGFFLWKYMEKEDSPYTTAACIGWIMGIIYYGGRIAWRFIQIGSSLN